MLVNVVLDLDQTLISALTGEEYKWGENPEKEKKFRYHDMDSYYIIFERPKLQKFLDFLFQNFNVSVWTAASKDYALFIIDKIILCNDKKGNPKNNRKLDYIFFSYHCNLSKKYKFGSKNLDMICNIYNIPGYTEKNTLIIDDYDEVHETQPERCILVKPFDFDKDGSENDKFLLKIIDELKKLKDTKAEVKEANRNLGTI